MATASSRAESRVRTCPKCSISPSNTSSSVPTPSPHLPIVHIDPKSKLIAITLPKDQLKTFHIQLSKFMSLMKGVTGKVYAPFSIQCSPVNPGAEMIVMMRPVQELANIFSDVDIAAQDENAIAKRFHIRVFQFISSEDEIRSSQLQTDIL